MQVSACTMPALTPAAALQVRPVSRLFKALGDDTRLRIVALLSHGELCVCHVQEALGLTQPNASRQLGILKNAGVVESRREGTPGPTTSSPRSPTATAAGNSRPSCATSRRGAL